MLYQVYAIHCTNEHKKILDKTQYVVREVSVEKVIGNQTETKISTFITEHAICLTPPIDLIIATYVVKALSLHVQHRKISSTKELTTKPRQ